MKQLHSFVLLALLTALLVTAVTGNVFRGTWSEAPSYAPPKDTGDMELAISADFNSLTGRWRYDSSGEWDGSWEGSRIVPKTLFIH